jgi:hypothetical protein
LISRVDCECAERLDYIGRFHLLKAKEETSRVVDHDPWLVSLFNKSRNYGAESLIALPKNGRIISISIRTVLKHETKIADNRAPTSRWNIRLMHMKCTRSDRLELPKCHGIPRWIKTLARCCSKSSP